MVVNTRELSCFFTLILGFGLVGCAQDLAGFRGNVPWVGVSEDAHIVFLANQLEDGAPVTGAFGGIDRADEVCQFWADQAGFDRSFKALISSLNEETINAKDRLQLNEGPIVMFSSRSDYEIIVENASELWSSCGSNLIQSEINTTAMLQQVDEGFVWTATDCSGEATYFNCGGWQAVEIDSNLSADEIDEETNYKLHQQLGGAAPFSKVFTDSYIFMVPCEKPGALVCISQ